ncbi:hypothetical protein [Burkholderia cepacia]|uniref:hypothetical protein n=1 Tax=Burkholderia cepacia TaxID=292 RepID=UPI001CF2D22F|nr:hypothetical protein [Burkholderia cepacia]MCA8027729.1 hypothetical protein [Burkholderia cepacia]MCA8080881.1 hypothetical protein [Burkholderia cepacia]
MIFLAEHDEFLAVLADEESVDRLFVSAIFEQHCRAACQAGGDNDHAPPSAALFFSCLEFDLVLMQADFSGPGQVSGKSRRLSKQVYSIFSDRHDSGFIFSASFFETMFIEHKSPRVMTPGFVLIPVS